MAFETHMAKLHLVIMLILIKISIFLQRLLPQLCCMWESVNPVSDGKRLVIPAAGYFGKNSSI